MHAEVMFMEEEGFRKEGLEMEEPVIQGLGNGFRHRLVKVPGRVLAFMGEFFGMINIWLPGKLAERISVTCIDVPGVKIQLTGCVWN